MMRRPDIPENLRREVLVEAGHRCAIPTCRHSTTEIAHIVPWSKVKEHTFGNLIALCPNCHTRYDKGEIDRKSMLQYKTNMALLNSRYGDLERRVLRQFAAFPDTSEILLNKALDILLMYLLDDGLIEFDVFESALKGEYAVYRITAEGRKFVQRWLNAEKLE